MNNELKERLIEEVTNIVEHTWFNMGEFKAVAEKAVNHILEQTGDRWVSIGKCKHGNEKTIILDRGSYDNHLSEKHYAYFNCGCQVKISTTTPPKKEVKS